MVKEFDVHTFVPAFQAYTLMTITAVIIVWIEKRKNKREIVFRLSRKVYGAIRRGIKCVNLAIAVAYDHSWKIIMRMMTLKKL